MKRGPKPKGNVLVKWSPKFAYAIGLLTADGCLSGDGRHIDFTSKDWEQVVTFRECLGLKTKIDTKYSGNGNKAYRLQFSDVLFYQFLTSIGLLPAKSKIIQSVSVSDEHFLDFLRGYFDGDGSSSSFYDCKWKKSYRFYISFASSSPDFLHWLRARSCYLLGIKGHIDYRRKARGLALKYAKRESVILSKNMYYSNEVPYLRRKYLKIQKTLHIIKSDQATKLANTRHQ